MKTHALARAAHRYVEAFREAYGLGYSHADAVDYAEAEARKVAAT